MTLRFPLLAHLRVNLIPSLVLEALICSDLIPKLIGRQIFFKALAGMYQVALVIGLIGIQKRFGALPNIALVIPLLL